MNKDVAERRNRAVGALLGLAVGDAIGTTVEFRHRGAFPPVSDMVGGGAFGLEAGQWTDDTSMALCLADSLLACGTLDQLDLMHRFVRWWREGENSCTGECFDIGSATAAALARFERNGNPVAGSTDPHSAGNGSLMRLAPVAIRWHGDRNQAIEAARGQSLTTHGAPAAVDACAFFAALLVDALAGAARSDVLAPHHFAGAPEIAAIAGGSWRGKSRDEIASSGYVVHTLEGALWCVDQASSFADAVLTAANLGDDADTVAAVTGQLAGALWGTDGIPNRWRKRLAWGREIEDRAQKLFDAGTAS